jgi:hypothetical protein
MHRTSITRRSSYPKSTIDCPWTKTIEEVSHFYHVDEEVGLSEERAREDFQRYGPNGNLSANIIIFFLFMFLCRTASRRGQTTLETYLRTIR